MKLPEGQSRLDLVKSGVGGDSIPSRSRRVISIDKLVEDPKNERKTFRGLEGLAQSIKMAGLIEPLTVTEESDGRYRILTGHRRFRAAKLAGLAMIEVMIRESGDESVRRQMSLISNIQREDLPPIELALALKDVQVSDVRAKTQDGLAELIGKSKAWVSDVLRILDLPKDILDKVRTSELSIAAESLSRIARVDSPADQRSLAEQLLTGVTHRVIRAEIDKINTKKGKPKRKARPGQKQHMKHVFTSTQHASVIIQSTQGDLTKGRIVTALKEALRDAEK